MGAAGGCRVTSPFGRRRCANHPTAWANSSGLCPACCRVLATTPEDLERRAALVRARTYVRLSLDVEARRARDRRKYMARMARKAGCA